MTDAEGDTYICAGCGDVFPRGNKDEVFAEAEANGFDPETCVAVCDDCYREVMERNRWRLLSDATPTLN